MKKLLFCLLAVLLFILGCNPYGNKEKILIVIDPTVSKLKDIRCLVEKKCLDIPNLKIIGLYNINQKYNFNDSKNFIKDNKLYYIELKTNNFNIDPDSLFCDNRCSLLFHDLFLMSDGIIFTGGPDIPPSLYHDKTGLNTDVEPYERLYELSFLYHLAGSKKPFLEERPGYTVLCICLGMQCLNIALGGSLVQDIPSQLYGLHYCEDVQSLPAINRHSNYWSNLWNMQDVSSYTLHPVNIIPGSFMEIITSSLTVKKVNILSSHHQCIRDLAKALKVAAVSDDGKIIEAVEHIKYNNLIGVQFHPENRFLFDGTERIFKKGEKSLKANELIDKESIEFHRSFWNYISILIIKPI
jgi:putative glutamine amidotransferase